MDCRGDAMRVEELVEALHPALGEAVVTEPLDEDLYSGKHSVRPR